METLLCARFCLPLLGISKPAWQSQASIITISYTNMAEFLSVPLASHCVKTAGWSFTQLEGYLRMVLLQIWAAWHETFPMGSLGCRGPPLSYFHPEGVPWHLILKISLRWVQTFTLLELCYNCMGRFNTLKKESSFSPQWVHILEIISDPMPSKGINSMSRRIFLEREC